MTEELAEQLATELDRVSRALGSPLPAVVVAACATHFGLLVRWNRTHNLTRLTEPAEAARFHYLDSLLPLLAVRERPAKAIDVGSGAGFPGLLAALLWPTTNVLLMEPSHKRQSFLRHAAAAMGLGNTEVVAPDATTKASLVLSRATFPSTERAAQLAPYLERSGPSAIAVWGKPAEVEDWRREVVAVEPAAHVSAAPYHVDEEPRAVLWALLPAAR